jgi:glycosyltransferase involved in cell wall biosynthesis
MAMAQVSLTMSESLLAKLPPPPPTRHGWPWTEASPVLPARMLDGKPWPKMTIVTPSFNQGEYLEETIRSVLLQNYPNLEYIVIDGGSADSSQAIIQQYIPWLSYWVSEPDNGQAHAINKGLQKAGGELFNWLNSDDYLMPGALAEIALVFANKYTDAVAAACVDFSPDEETLVTNANLSLEKLIVWRPGTMYHQPAFWLRRQGVLACGGIDDNLHYVFDWEMVLRYLAQFPRVHYLPAIVARFRLHADSKTISRAQLFEAERVELWQKFKQTWPDKKLRKLCDRHLRHQHWLKLLRHYEDEASGTKFSKAAAVGGLACLDPAIRFNRMTAGAIKRHLFGGYTPCDYSVT